ncbi:MAG: class I SAM-dependent methyltransferase [Alphaproteobacteria bacterium]|nr:class I SAM-dependent methyltransferase [Alphaproteobacteria bacterium]
MPEEKIRQAQRPHGFWGRVFGKLMDFGNAKAHAFAVKRLEVRPDDRILEIGFGTGRVVKKAAKYAREGFIAGIDPSELMLERASKRSRRLIRKGRVELKLGDVSDLPWPDAHFDKVVALHSFQFWNDPQHDIAQVRRVLKPNGLLLLVLRQRRRPPNWLPNPISRSRQEIAGTLQLLTEAGFRETRIEGKAGSSAVITARKPA